jgi:flagellar basal-body rod protein FlgB
MGQGNGIVDYLSAGLRAAGMRQAAIANNIANVNTPGYRRYEVKFEELLAEAMGSSGRGGPGGIEPLLVQADSAPDAGGGAVDMDHEVGELLKNSGTYKVYVRLLTKMYQQMELAMQEP